MVNKKVNRSKTIKNIVNKINTFVGHETNFGKWSRMKMSDKSLIECAEYVDVTVVYD